MILICRMFFPRRGDTDAPPSAGLSLLQIMLQRRKERQQDGLAREGYHRNHVQEAPRRAGTPDEVRGDCGRLPCTY